MLTARPTLSLLRRRLLQASCRHMIRRLPNNGVATTSPMLQTSFSSLPNSTGSTDSPLPATTQTTTALAEPAVTIPIDFQTSAKIEGEESHIVTVHLEPGQVLRAESGAMLFMTDGVEMDTHLSGASSAFSRMLTGQNVFLTDFKYNPAAATTTKAKNQNVGTVALGTDFPSKILRLNLQEYGGSLICQRGAFLASNPNVQIEMAYTKSLTSGFFGGQGFILQRLVGDGDVLVKAGGTSVRKELKDGETLRVSSGSIVAFTSSVDYDVQMMPGIKNVMFSGEGLFVTTLKGPGTVWLQGLPSDRMIAEIVSRIPPGMGFGIPIPLGGGSTGDAGAAGDVGAAGDTAAAAGTEGVVADAAVGEGSSAATDSAGDASGDAVDADSPSALFGDAFPSDAAQRNTTSTAEASQETTWDDTSSSSSSQEPSLTDTDFEQSESFSTRDEFAEDELFEDDSTITDAFSSDSAQQPASEGMLQTLWDFFMGDDR